MARAGGGEFVGVDEETSIGIARVDGHHAVVDVFLGALAVVTRGEETASGVGGEAGLEAGGLGVVVVAVAVLFGDVLEDDAPVAFDVDGAADLGVVDGGGAEVALGSGPVAEIEGGGALGGAGVVRVVESRFLVGADVLDEVVGGLLGNVGVFFEENGILRDLVGDLVVGVFGIFDTEGEVRVKGALGRGFGVAVAVGAGCVGGGVGRSVVGGDWVGGGVRIRVIRGGGVG